MLLMAPIDDCHVLSSRGARHRIQLVAILFLVEEIPLEST